MGKTSRRDITYALTHATMLNAVTSSNPWAVAQVGSKPIEPTRTNSNTRGAVAISPAKAFQQKPRKGN